MSNSEILSSLSSAVVEFDDRLAARLAQQALDQGVDPIEIVEGGLARGMKEVGDRFAKGDLFLPELMLAASAFQAAMKVVNPAIAAVGKSRRRLGRVLLGTVEGDIHDLGKNIVGILADAAGFEVIDVGFNVKAATFVSKVRELKPEVVGMSAMLTSTRARMREVVDALQRAGLRDRLKIIVGGAVVSTQFAQEIGADAYGINAEDGVRKMRQLVGAQEKVR